MDIEEYARKHPQFYDETIPPLLLEYLARCPEGVVLEAGCGDGSLLRALHLLHAFEGRRVHAVDISAERIANVRKLDPRIAAFVDDVETLASVSAPVDFAISTQVIEHVDDDRMIAALARALRPGGILYLSTVFKRWYGWYFYRNRGRWVLDPTHLREYTRDDDLLAKLRLAGFAILETRKEPCRYAIADLFYRLIRLDNRTVLGSRILRSLRKVRAPILGYYNWEIVAQLPAS